MKNLRIKLALLLCIPLLIIIDRGYSAEGGVIRSGETADRWEQVVGGGLGDRQNSTVWSMVWWKDRLYIGTLRSFICWRAAIWENNLPNPPYYPPSDAAADCPPDLADIPLRAEIWQYNPGRDSWKRVYRSPQNVPIPGRPGKFIARDTGYRGMLVFPEPDGTESLYVMGVSPREVYGNSIELPPPRILRTIDGTNFEEVPQKAGTFLGDLEYTSLRSGTIYKNKMYISNGSARGEGILIESANPKRGNNKFRPVMDPDTIIWDAIVFNDYLYVAVADQVNGFSLLKTDAEGEPPYEFKKVIVEGGYLSSPSASIVSLHVFNNQLYAGTYAPAELYRISGDDSWELLIGKGRQTPRGWVYPLSGLEAGFGWPYNIQIYRMHDYNGELYLGTLDTSREVTQLFPGLDPRLSWQYGFDLYKSKDGVNFEAVTITGLDESFQVAVRTFSTTPYGLFMGTGSYWYGFDIWLQSRSRQYFLPITLTD
jgi:hypothetical protein